METPRHRQTLEVAFGDTDASGWMYFPNIFRYFDIAEHAYLRSLGLLVYDRAQGGWPRVNVSCDFKKPLLTADLIEVQIDITRIGAASLTWAFEVIKDGEIAAQGSITTVRVDHEGRPKIISPEERGKLDRGL
jgi:YbgC/YbaW family acyl-CoA thioester hydrolase